VLVSACLTVLAISAVFLIFGQRTLLLREQRALLNAFDKLPDYDVDTVAISPGGKTAPLRTEVHQGSNWQLSLWGGKVVFTKIGETYTTFESAANVEYRQNSWSGSTDYLKRLVSAIVESDPWQHGQRLLRRLPDVGDHERYLLNRGPARYTVEVDRNLRPISVALDRLGEAGWAPSEFSEFHYGDEDVEDPRKADTKTTDLTQPYVRDDLYATDLQTINIAPGRAAVLRAAVANDSGTVFFLVEGLPDWPVATVTASDNAVYNAIPIKLQPNDDGRFDPFYVVIAERIAPSQLKWPVHFVLSLTSKDLSFKSHFTSLVTGPGCGLIPDWFNWSQAGDLKYFDYMRLSDKLRGDYYSHHDRYRGEIVPYLTARRRKSEVPTEPEREKGLAYELAAIADFYHYSLPQTVTPDDDFLAEAWFAIYQDLVVVGDKAGPNGEQRAKQALQFAHAASRSDLGGMETHLDIRMAMDHEGMQLEDSNGG